MGLVNFFCRSTFYKVQNSWAAFLHLFVRVDPSSKNIAHCQVDFFHFLYLKKIKISKIYSGFEKFQNYTPVAPCLGDRGPVALWLGDRT